MTKLRVLDLFSGIGGFSLGLERTGGFETVAFCEIDPFCRRVLAKHWPKVPCYEDVRELSAARLAADGIQVDVICGGFPCQDISFAGYGAGLEGERSGLWSEFARLVGELRPEFVIVENVAALIARGLDQVLGTLATIGYDAEWHCIPAGAVGFEHERDRTWIIAYPDRDGELQLQGCQQDRGRRYCNGSTANVAHLDEARHERRRETGTDRDNVARIYAWLRSALHAPHAVSRDHWNHQPIMGRRLHGISNRVDRVGALGNAVVPQIPEIIGSAILSVYEERTAA